MMKAFVASVLLLALTATAGASNGVHHLGLSETEAHGRRLLVDTRGSDPIGADTIGNGKGAKLSAQSLPTATAPTAYMAKAPMAMMAKAPMMAPMMAQTPMMAMSAVFPSVAKPYGAAAPMSAPAGQSAPSVMGRRLLVDYRGSDPVGADTKGNGAVSSLSVKNVFKTAPAASPMAAPMSAGGPVPLSTILYSSVPTANKYTLATAPTTAPGALAAPSLGGRRHFA